MGQARGCPYKQNNQYKILSSSRFWGYYSRTKNTFRVVVVVILLTLFFFAPWYHQQRGKCQPQLLARYQQNAKAPSNRHQVAAAALSKRRNDSQQSNLGFGAKEKYSVGLKLLLPDTIYGKRSAVSTLHFPLLYCCFWCLQIFYVLHCSPFTFDSSSIPIGTTSGSWIPFRI
jgi:hypothetical protein